MRRAKRLRQQTRELRSGRAWATRAAGRPAETGPPRAAAYSALTAHLDRLRAALADQHTDRPMSEVHRDQDQLERGLGVAVAAAFAADAHASALPVGVSSWAGEGLARSYERELLLLADGQFGRGAR